MSYIFCLISPTFFQSLNGFSSKSKHRWLSISRMLDLGGLPSALTDKKVVRNVNASKNSKVQAVAFDFDMLTRCLQKDLHSKNFKNDRATKGTIDNQESTGGNVVPDVAAVENVAKLLGVRLDGSGVISSRMQKQEDHSVLLETTKNSVDEHNPKSGNDDARASSTSVVGDVKIKYAARLRKKLEGGLAGMEMAQTQREESLKHGDASVHLAARAIAKQIDAGHSSVGSAATRWIPLTTGTGSLLNYISNRSMKIALLPKPNNPNPATEEKQMVDFSNQLQEVHFDVVLKAGVDSASKAVQQALSLLGVEPAATLLVTDRDDYIGAAKDAGLVTCRVRPLNAPRGNASAHFSRENVGEVQEVIDEMNGISYNALLNR